MKYDAKSEQNMVQSGEIEQQLFAYESNIL